MDSGFQLVKPSSKENSCPGVGGEGGLSLLEWFTPLTQSRVHP